MGIANVIPGVSGGTVALITGIYEELINSLKSFDKKNTSATDRAKRGYYQKGGSIKSPQESASSGIGIKNHEARMMNNLKKIQGDKEIKDMLKRRVTNPEKYRAHIKARVKSGTMMSDKEVTETLNYFKKRNSLKQNPRMKLDHYQAGGMVTSTGDNMGGVQMDSRRLLNLANKRKSYGK